MRYNYLLKWVVKCVDGKSSRMGCFVRVNTNKALKNNKL